MARLLVVGWRNRAGLSRDLTILSDVLQSAGHVVEVQGLTPPRRARRWWRRLRAGGPPWDLVLFAERAVPEWLDLARRSVLIPNPEWFEPTPWLKRLDALFCKTASAVELFAPIHHNVRLLGFSGRPGMSRPAGDDPERWRRLIHVAGRSPNKGTRALLTIWQRHPDWPTLRVIAWREQLALPDPLPANVELLDGFVEDDRLRALQATAGIHLCPSEAEGFGHTLIEGLAAGAVVLTTDAPPMNELVTPDRGVLVPWYLTEPVRLGHRYVPRPEALEQAIEGVLGWEPDRLRRIGAAARTWYEANDAAFRGRLVVLVNELLTAT